MIPAVALFNHKIDFRNSPLPEYQTLTSNINNTLKLTGLTSHHFYNETQCQTTMEELQNRLGIQNLRASYNRYEDGRIRSDMCRLGMLWIHGGFYFDNDIVTLRNVRDVISQDTEFASCTTAPYFKNPPGLFQAFVATRSQHPVVERALRYHVEWFRWVDAKDTQRIRHVTGEVRVRPNIGTVLLRDAMVDHYGEGTVKHAERTGSANGGTIRLFREMPLSQSDHAYALEHLCIWCTNFLDPCNFAVVDVYTGMVLFKSRIADQATRSLCPVYCANEEKVRQKRIQVKKNSVVNVKPSNPQTNVKPSYLHRKPSYLHRTVKHKYERTHWYLRKQRSYHH